MHSVIIQLDSSPIAPEDYITESDYYEADWCDYTDDSLSSSEKMNVITNLVRKLDGVVEAQIEGDKIVLNVINSVDNIKAQWLDKIKQYTTELTIDNLMCLRPRLALKLLLNDPLESDIKFRIYDGDDDSAGLIELIEGIGVGGKIYVGNILNYRF
jgi:hypothetical protein